MPGETFCVALLVYLTAVTAESQGVRAGRGRETEIQETNPKDVKHSRWHTDFSILAY